MPKPGGELGPTNIGGVTPNKPGLVFEPGVARLLRGNSDIVMQMHYTTNGTEGEGSHDDRRHLREAAADEDRRRRDGDQPALRDSGRRRQRRSARASRPITRDTLVTSVHAAHARARQGHDLHRALSRTARPRRCCRCRSYDFNWQITYELAKPKLLPKGTKLEVIAHYDNSTANKFNPDPTKDVRWGDQTWEEMMIGFWGTVQDAPARTTTQQQ